MNLFKNLPELYHQQRLGLNVNNYFKNNTLTKSLEHLTNEQAEKLNRNFILGQIWSLADKGKSVASYYVSNWLKRKACNKKNIDDLIFGNVRATVSMGPRPTAVLKDFHRSSEKVVFQEFSNFQ
jgi:hypothetical protein